MQPALLNSWIERKEQMARPQKKGLLYFPFDTDFFADLKIRALSARYGSDGLIFYIWLLAEIYRENGYYIVWNEDSEDAAIASLGLSEGSMKQIMTFLASRSLIVEITLASSDTIITSPNIQKRYQEAAKSLRREIIVDCEIWLLNEEETASFIKVTQNSDKYSKNNNKSVKNESKSRKNPTNKIKVNEMKVNEREGAPAKHSYGSFGNVMLLDDEFTKLADKYGADIRNDAIEFLDMYIEEKGYKTKSHYLAIIRWVVNAVNERRQKQRRGYQSNMPKSIQPTQERVSALDEMEALFQQEVNGFDKGRKN
jgi:hypothetical protein